jgi:hypothetical protein
MRFSKVKYKCEDARVVKCTQDGAPTFVVEIMNSEGKWMPFAVKGFLDDAIKTLISFLTEREKYRTKMKSESKNP